MKVNPLIPQHVNVLSEKLLFEVNVNKAVTRFESDFMTFRESVETLCDYEVGCEITGRKSAHFSCKMTTDQVVDCYEGKYFLKNRSRAQFVLAVADKNISSVIFDHTP